MSFCVEYYELENGTCPVEEFILKQDNKMQAKIFKNLELLEIRGNELREPFQNILKTVFLKSEIKLEMILPEFLFLCNWAKNNTYKRIYKENAKNSKS